MPADSVADPVFFNCSLQDSEDADRAEVRDDVDVLADAVSFILKDRLCPDKAKHVAEFEGRLLASLATLQLICSELREIRIKKAAA